ncbi:hypothetical protein O6H91_16G077000 [Diphasiastrum complanatum]|uniref:Uncharacterized protein n=1 Tax=Diphasiastrum complanatum TaxID=34168 RepID=A0ACC2BDT3_DIPCM|nr:hypothetical protein O6H91_16G077000 [Diphasiastrum complanatum]
MCSKERRPLPALKLPIIPLPLPPPPAHQSDRTESNGRPPAPAQHISRGNMRGRSMNLQLLNESYVSNLGYKLPSALPSENRDPNLLDDLERGEILGHGSSGRVYKVVHKRTGSVYALKVIQAKHDPAVRKQIKKEMEISRRHCGHSSFVVQCYGVFERMGEISLVMELMNDGTLADLLAKHKKIPEHFLSFVSRHVLKGLKYLHSKKIVHRDIKPSNLLLNRNPQLVKIADFGVSTELASTFAQCNSFVGTCAYFSPERFDPDVNGGKYDCSADIWSLGLTLLECALGYFPCLKEGQKPDWPTLICNICLDDPPAPPKDASPEFQNFIRLCLQKDATLRPSAHQLLMHPFLQIYEDHSCTLSTSLETLSL